ncbi:MAG: sigma 54-interacting transcriptional regulator [Sandaracinaceae bacterium]
MSGRILYVDDDPDACALASVTLRGRGYDVVTQTNARAAIDLALIDQFDTVVTDLRLGALDGLAVCERIVAAKPNLPVVVVTGHATMAAAVGALRAGAYDFVSKPFDPDLLLAAVRRATQSSRLREEVTLLRATVATEASVGAMIGDSVAMRAVYRNVARIAATDASVLITGASGTGKELIARKIHELSDRARGPFVAINCAAVPEALLESELFGHVRGAFTDAKVSRGGLFLEANGGTLFLDEVGEMSPSMQAKLLRALQERTVRPVGGAHEVSFDARLISATATELEAAVDAKTFRADFYYRINVCSVHVPPLREREGDIALLAQRFVVRFAEQHGRAITGLTSQALAKLIAYRWPGNVRELENCIERAVTMTQTDLIVPADLPEHVVAYRPSAPHGLMPSSLGELLTIAELEAEYVAHVLSLVSDNKSHAARLLGIDRRTLHRKILGARQALPDGSPAVPTEARSDPPDPAAVERDAGRPAVLIVDRDVDGREMLGLLLSSRGLAVREASSTTEALSRLEGVACVLVSGSPSDGDPRALVTRDGPPVLIIDADADTLPLGGFREVLRKPARVDDVMAAVRRALAAGGWR